VECPRWTPGNVKLLLSPRQSRGFTQAVSRSKCNTGLMKYTI
jgi:hypothetical protein